MNKLSVTTDAFPPGGNIPGEFTCSGKNESPPLTWSGVPDGTRSIAVLCSDPDAPSGIFIHWVLYNIPAGSSGLEKGIPRKPVLENGSLHGMNSYGKLEYSGPCPPPGAAHRYFFRVYALDIPLALRSPASAKVLENAISGHILAEGEVMGMFRR